jgi:aspartate kinase
MRCKRMTASGEVAVVAGFQGVAEDNRVTTLGRGGSDTSAVALAAALKAERCDIYTDVDGVYTTDPRIVRGAQA